MASKKDWVVEIVAQIVKDAPTANMVVERLMEEGLLVLGYGNPDVDKIVMKFTDAFGTTKVTRQDRYAAHRLASAHGSQAICGIVDLLAANSAEKYAPVVNSVAQFEDKLSSIRKFIGTLYGDQVIDV